VLSETMNHAQPVWQRN